MSNIFSDLENHVEVEYDYIKFGIEPLDGLLLGIKKGTYGVLSGSSGTGKSLYAGWFFRSFISQGYKTAYFNMELSHDEMMNRLSGFPPLDNKPKTSEGSRILTGVKSMQEIDSYVMLEKPDVVIIDWLGLIQINGTDKYAGQRQIAHKLKAIAEKNNIAILLINQVNKLSTANGGINWYGANAGVSEIYDLCALYIGIYDRINAKGTKVHIPDELKGLIELHVDKGRFRGQTKGIAVTRRQYNFLTRKTSIEGLDWTEDLGYREIMDIQ